MSGRKVLKRACDGCKIRKIKCSEVAPCEGCMVAGIACTFVKHPATRGPRKLRKSTLQEISQTQQQWEQLALPSPKEDVVRIQPNADNVFAPAKIAALVLQLCVYRLRMYPVWPIIKVERLVASLQKPDADIEVLAMAYAVAAATIARIKPKEQSDHGGTTAKVMESQCQYTKERRNHSLPPDLTTVRIPFFLHVYHEELEPGGLNSIKYLREAITIAQMIGLHREVYYRDVQPEEQEIRRRTLWLLFVTERSISIKHKLPVIIKTSIAFPSTVDTDEREVLAAYQKLISMFWHFDKSGVFEILDGYNFDLSSATLQKAVENGAFTSIRRQLDSIDIASPTLNDIQAFDIFVTRHWMRIILWRLAASHGFFSQESRGTDNSYEDPISVAKELLDVVTQADKTIIEAHGPALETKIFEIASTVADACTISTTEPASPGASYRREQAKELLLRMHRVLLKNRHLASLLQAKILRMQLSPNLEPQNTVPNHTMANVPPIDPEIESQLDAHGFHFTELGDFEESPETSSSVSDQYHAVLRASFLSQQTHRDLQLTGHSALLGPLQSGSTAWSSSVEGINFDLDPVDINDMYHGMDYTPFRQGLGGA